MRIQPFKTDLMFCILQLISMEKIYPSIINGRCFGNRQICRFNHITVNTHFNLSHIVFICTFHISFQNETYTIKNKAGIIL